MVYTLSGNAFINEKNKILVHTGSECYIVKKKIFF